MRVVKAGANPDIRVGREVQDGRDALGVLFAERSAVKGRVLTSLVECLRGHPCGQQIGHESTFDRKGVVERILGRVVHVGIPVELLRGVRSDQIDRAAERVFAKVDVLRALENLHPRDIGHRHRCRAAGDEDPVDEQRP